MPVERERVVKAIEDLAKSMALDSVRNMSSFCRELGTLVATLSELKITAPEATEICMKAVYRTLSSTFPRQ